MHWRSLSIALLYLGSSVAVAQESQQALDGMRAALQQNDFVGEIVLLRDGQLEALEIDHAVEGDRTQIRPLNRMNGEISQQGQRISFAADQILDLGEALRTDAPDFARSYQLRIAGEDRVAGRVVHVIEAHPRDAWRFGRRFWIDRATGLPLRAAIRSTDGGVIEQWMFTRIELRAPGAQATTAAAPSQRYVGPQAESTSQSRFRVEGMPEGFTLLAASRTEDSEHLVLADGLSKVSVFVEPMRTGQQVLTGAHRRGALHVFGRVIPGHQIVVVGEVPAPTVERIAQGVTSAGGG